MIETIQSNGEFNRTVIPEADRAVTTNVTVNEDGGLTPLIVVGLVAQ